MPGSINEKLLEGDIVIDRFTKSCSLSTRQLLKTSWYCRIYYLKLLEAVVFDSPDVNAAMEENELTQSSAPQFS